jgi:Holliday junction resolvase-like predicted endonuclease
MPNNAHTIVKANGGTELFSPEKLYRSLVQSGASEEDADTVTSHVRDSLSGTESTQDIYARAFMQLRTMARPVAARYSVKRALLELGPSGYPFEDFLAQLYRARGYETHTRSIHSGACTTHEIDLVAQTEREYILAEVKFHNSAGTKSDTKVALYVQARFDDIRKLNRERVEEIQRYMLITNTKCTTQAREYAQCVGLELLTWEYPEHANLRILIEQAGVHPISCLTTLSRTQKLQLMQKGVVLCKQLHDDPSLLEQFSIPPRGISAIQQEIQELCMHVRGNHSEKGYTT